MVIWRMNARERSVVKKMSQIVAFFYAPYFLKARLSTASPRHDLEFYYPQKGFVEPQEARRGLNSLHRHPWYLVPEQAVPCLFDDKQTGDKEIKEYPASHILVSWVPNFQPVVALMIDTRLSMFVTMQQMCRDMVLYGTLTLKNIIGL